MSFFTLLTQRSLLRLGGPDARSFLQGLVTNDVMKVSPAKSLYAAMLTPQGKFLFDFFILQQGEDLLLDIRRPERDALAKRLGFYKLRAQITLTPEDGLQIAALWGEDASATRQPEETIATADPRDARLGLRLFGVNPTAPAGALPTAFSEYERHRITLGTPEAGSDLIAEKSFILDHRFEALHGVDFSKGCYVGQEVTARTKHRGTIRKSLYLLHADSALPPTGTAISLGEKSAGQLGSRQDNLGLALLRIEDVEDATRTDSPFICGDQRVKISPL